MSGGVERFREDEQREQTFDFTAGVLSWKTFAGELADYARRAAGDRPRRVRGGHHFAEYARGRLRAWRDGDVAG